MAGAWFKNETTQPQNIVACSRITTNGVTSFTTNNKDGKCIGDNDVVAENTIKDIAYLNTIQEKGNQKANNELKIATNSTACEEKYGKEYRFEWSMAKEEKNVCQSDKTIGMIQEINGKYFLFYKRNNNIIKKEIIPDSLTNTSINSVTLLPLDDIKNIFKNNLQIHAAYLADNEGNLKEKIKYATHINYNISQYYNEIDIIITK